MQLESSFDSEGEIQMVKLPEIGKITSEIFDELIYPRLGAKNNNVVIGPRHGVDAGIAKIGGKAVAMTTDPVFIVPEYGFEKAAWFAIHILVSDVVTSGLPPTYLSIDLNLPLSMTKRELETIWQVINRECKKIGINIICGHTARYDNCNYPMVGGATVLAVGKLSEYVAPVFIRPGDALIITKGPAIEACGIFATMFPKLIKSTFGLDFAERAEKLFYKMSVVKDAQTAIKIGIRDRGVSAMHDATECGILGGVYEMAQASKLGVVLERESIVMEDCVPEICRYFEIDPFKSISEGTLLIACRHHKAESLVKILAANDIKSSIAGEFVPRRKGLSIIENGRKVELKHPKVDPFWNAFYRALQNYKDIGVKQKSLR